MRKEVEIVNELGLHARPAAAFVRCAQDFKSDVFILKDGHRYRADSIIDVMTANLDCGERVELEAEGYDAPEALDRLAALLLELRHFDESEAA